MSAAGLIRRAVAAVMVVAGLASAPGAGAAEAPEGDLGRVAEKVFPSVVTLHVERSEEVAAALPDELQRFFEQQFRRKPPPALESFLRNYFHEGRGTRGLGSGVIVDESGLVVTNAHVVRGAAAVTAELSTGERMAAEVLGADGRSDIAVVRLAGKGPFRPIEKAPPGELRAGDRVVVVGSPLGFAGTVSAGVVSHPARYLPPGIGYIIREGRGRDIYYGRLIQTDALVNRGSSGGALVDSKGRLVGIAVLLYGSDVARRSHPFPIPRDALRAFGFAIPVEKLNRIAPVLAGGREVAYGYLGIAPKTLEVPLAEALGLGRRRGVVVDFVEDGSPASRAGLVPGEVIVAMDGVKFAEEGDLVEAVGAAGPDTEVAFEVALPGGEVRTVKAKLVRRRSFGPRRPPAKKEKKKEEEAKDLWRGIEFEDQRGEVRLARVRSGSPGSRAGLRPAMRIGEAVIAGSRVKFKSAEELRKVLAGARGAVAFRTDAAGYVAVPAE